MKYLNNYNLNINMRIHLENFRCYADKVFDLGSKGLTLISGPSGKGKSTILLSIFFALYGTGNKLIKHGKSSCRVELEFDGIKIVRSKRPNHLIVNDTYENDAGQNVIYEKFGKNFDMAGYIQQNASKSFILMSPLEKLGFLERFAFQGVNLSEIKKKCKNSIKMYNEELISIVSKLEMASAVLKELKEPVPVSFPIKCSKRNIPKAIKNTEIKYKNSNILLKRLRKKKKLFEDELNSLKVLITHKESYQNQHEEATEEYSKISDKLRKLKTEYKGEDEIEKYKEQIESIRSIMELTQLKRKYDEDTKRLEDMKESEIDDMQSEIDSIDEELWKEYTRKEVDENIKDLKQICKDIEKIKALHVTISDNQVESNLVEKQKQEIQDLETLIENKKQLLSKVILQKEVYTCPSCDCNLKLRDGKLYSFEQDMVEDADADVLGKEIDKALSNLRRLKKKQQKDLIKQQRYLESKEKFDQIQSQYEEDLMKMENIEEDINVLKKYKESQQLLERKKNSLENNIKTGVFSPTCKTFEKSVKELKSRINTLKKKTKNTENLKEEEIRAAMISQQNIKNDIQRLSKDEDNLRRKRDFLQKKLTEKDEKHLKNFNNIRTLEEICEDIDNCSREKEELDNKREKAAKNIELISKWEECTKEKSKYDEWKSKVIDLEKDEIVKRKAYAAASLLKEKILEAESISIHNVIDSINSHAKAYLDQFFTDDPIVVTLEPFKETKSSKTKKVKPQINVRIVYKGMEADLNMLSGGEISRVVLSFTLALTEIFNTPLLMLDECTASLDQELTNSVIGGIRNNFNGNLVLLIAHQVTEGVYDQVVKI